LFRKEEIKMTLGNKISEFRKEKGMTQEVLANQLGVSNQAVSKWEANHAQLAEKKLIAWQYRSRAEIAQSAIFFIFILDSNVTS